MSFQYGNRKPPEVSVVDPTDTGESYTVETSSGALNKSEYIAQVVILNADGTVRDQVPVGGFFMPSDIEVPDGCSTRVDKVPVIWDGTIDTSWYDKNSSEFHLSFPAQVAGLAALVNGTFDGYPLSCAGSPDSTINLNGGEGGLSSPVNQALVLARLFGAKSSYTDAQKEEANLVLSLYGTAENFVNEYTFQTTAESWKATFKYTDYITDAESIEISVKNAGDLDKVIPTEITRTVTFVGNPRVFNNMASGNDQYSAANFTYVDDASIANASSYQTGYYSTGSSIQGIYPYTFGIYNVANADIYIERDMDFGAWQENGIWSKLSPNYIPIGGQFCARAGYSFTHVSAGFNGRIFGQGHKFKNVYCNRGGRRDIALPLSGKTIKGTALKDDCGIGLIGRLGTSPYLWERVNGNLQIKSDYSYMDCSSPKTSHAGVYDLELESGLIYGMNSVGGVVGLTGYIDRDDDSSVAPYRDGDAYIDIQNCVNRATVLAFGKKGTGGIVGFTKSRASVVNNKNYGKVVNFAGYNTSGICGINEYQFERNYVDQSLIISQGNTTMSENLATLNNGSATMSNSRVDSMMETNSVSETSSSSNYDWYDINRNQRRLSAK